MIPVLAAVCVWLPALIGLGQAILRPLRIVDPLPPVFAVVIGFAALATLGNVLNFWTALTPAHALLFLMAGWGMLILKGIGFARRTWGTWGLPRLTGLRVAGGVGVGAVLLLTATTAAEIVTTYDAGLYHVGAVRWLTNSPVVLGLANLHGRFGFNPSWLTAAAMLEVPGVAGHSHQVTNAILFAAYGIALIGVFTRPLSRPALIFAAATGPIWLMLPLLGTVNSHAPDFPILILTLLMTFLAVEGIGAGKSQRDYAGALGLTGLAWLVAAFAVTVKFSALPLMLIPLAMVCTRRQIGLSPGAAALIGVMVTAWAGRGIALSGCVAYPVSQTCLPVVWAVPIEAVKMEAIWVQSWARAPFTADYQAVLGSAAWLGRWVQDSVNEAFNAPFRVGYAAVMAMAGLLIGSVQPPKPGRSPYRLPALILLIGVGYWFLTAPALRFGHGYLLGLGALGLAGGLYAVDPALLRRLQLPALGGIIITATLGAVTRLPIVAPDHWPPLFEDVAETRTTDQGVTVYTPRYADQCWAAPLPCTPYFNPALWLQCTDGRCMFTARKPNP